MGVLANAILVVVVSVTLVVAIVILVAIAARRGRVRRGADRCVSLARLPGAGVSLLANHCTKLEILQI